MSLPTRKISAGVALRSKGSERHIYIMRICEVHAFAFLVWMSMFDFIQIYIYILNIRVILYMHRTIHTYLHMYACTCTSTCTRTHFSIYAHTGDTECALL